MAVIVIAARHAHVSKNELRKECQVEADEHNQGGQARPTFGIEAARNFRPPEMHAAQVAHDGTTHHDVVEVGDHEISIGDVDVDTESRKKKSCQPADGKQAEESEGIEHGRIVTDGALIESGRPVKDFNSRGQRDSIAKERKHQRGINRNSRDEHMVGPDQEAEDGDGDGRKSDEAVTEDALAREAGDDLSYDAHRWQNHDVDRGMRVKPEQMLEENRIAAKFRMKD